MNKEKYFKNGYFNDTISSTILFVIAYLFVLYVSLFSTAFISFTNQITVPLRIDMIDFDRAVSSGDSFWNSADNIFTIFSFAPLTLFLMLLTALMLTHKFKTETFSVFLFWIIFHTIIRLFGDFIFGQIFMLWGSNLIMDFMGLTSSNVYMKLLFISIAIILTILSLFILMPMVFSFFNPRIHKIIEGVRINFIIPAFLATGILYLWFIPHFNIKEIVMPIFALIMLLIFSKFIIKRYGFMEFSGESQDNDKFNIRLNLSSIFLPIIILFTLKIILFNKPILRSSDFRRDQLDTIFYSSIIIVLATTFICLISYIIYAKRKKRNIHNREMQETLNNISNETMDESLLDGTIWEGHLKSIEKAEKIKE